MQIFKYLIVRQARVIAGVGLVLALVATYYSILLYTNLRTDIEELLPTTSRSVKDLNQVTSRMESIDSIVILIFSNQTKASQKFVLNLSQEIEKLPKDLVASIEYRIDHEIQFFKDRMALYLDLPDLIKIKGYVRERINYETSLYNPLNIFSGIDIPEPHFDFRNLRNKYEQKASGYDHLPGGFYATSDEKVRAIVVYMPGKGLEKAQRMKTEIERAVSRLKPLSYAEDMEIKYTGNLQNLLEESSALVEDLEISTLICTALVSVAMLLFFRSLWATLALVLSLFMGTLWTFGVAYFVVGYLNANTAFLASIVIGNGINFGTIVLARYIEVREAGANHLLGIERTVRSVAPATLTAALAAGLSYGSLLLTGFRGFSQFGVIGLMGMVLCWISAFTLLPSFLTLLDNAGLIHIRVVNPLAKTRSPLHLLSRFIERWPGFLWNLSMVGIFLSLYFISRFQGDIIETDLSKLRDKNCVKKGSGALYHYIDDIFKHSFSPMVILPKERDAARTIAGLFEKEKEREGEKSLITMVQTLDNFIPKQQEQKINELLEIKKMLPERLIENLPKSERRIADILLNPRALTPFTERELPALILNRFRETDGSIGKTVLVDKAFQKEGDDANALVRFVKLGREITDSVGKNIPVAGGLPISYDMYESIINDGPKATLCAFLAVVLLVILMFRNLKTIALVLFSLLLGVLWLGGLVAGLNLKINFLNFIALPITFGIGVDYGVNIFSRYREEGPGSIAKVIRDTGGAVLLCSLSTIIGYSSLLIAGNQAFVSFGRLAVLGELTCVVAGVISLPAFLVYREKRRLRKLSP